MKISQLISALEESMVVHGERSLHYNIQSSAFCLLSDRKIHNQDATIVAINPVDSSTIFKSNDYIYTLEPIENSHYTHKSQYILPSSGPTLSEFNALPSDECCIRGKGNS